MKNKLLNFIRKSYFPYVIFILILALIHIKIKITPGDDEWFFKAVDTVGNGSLLKYLQWRYEYWTGRIVIEAIMVNLITMNIWLWKIVNIIIITILSYVIYKLIPKIYTEKLRVTQKHLIKILICFAILAMQKSVFGTGIRWITGSFNYLWPMTCGLIAMLPYKYTIFNEKYNKKYFVMYFLLVILAANAEQVSLVVLCFALLANIYIFINKKKIDVLLILHNIFIGINTVILFAAPGNYVRAQQETVNWFVNWDMISLVEKIQRGTNLLLNHLFNNNILLVGIVLMFICLSIFSKYQDNFIRFISVATVIFLVVKVLPIDSLFDSSIKIESRIHSVFFNIKNLNLFNFNDFIKYIPTFLTLCILFLVPLLLFLAFNNMKTKLLTIVLYLAAICSGLSISISPTIYASGDRVFFVTDVLFIVILALLTGEILKDRLQKKNLFIVSAIVIISVGLLKSLYWLT